MDEIQEVQGWERVINSILSEWDADRSGMQIGVGC